MISFETLEKQLLGFKGAYLDFPFGPEAAVFKVMGKMFALVAWQEKPLTITLKCDPEKALEYRAIFAAVQPGYYMNKRHWNTVTLDGSAPDDVLDEMIAASYGLVVKGLTLADRKRLARGETR